MTSATPQPVAREEVALLFLYAETPVHVGSGASTGYVDLPIARERMSQLPMIPGSGLKGCMRELLSAAPGSQAHDEHLALFGPEPPEGKAGSSGDQPSDYAGALSFSDARLLLFPIRSARGGWAWLTAPMALDRLRRDLAAAVWKGAALPTVEAHLMSPEPSNLSAGGPRALAAGGAQVVWGEHALLEDMTLKVVTSASVAKLAEWLAAALPPGSAYDAFRQRLPRQLLVVDDTTFTRAALHHTEVATRVRIDPKTHTVMDGALWTEEALPAESLLWSVIHVGPSRQEEGRQKKRTTDGGLPQPGVRLSPPDAKKELISKLKPHPRLRLGGDRATGRGLMGVRLLGEGGDHEDQR